MTVKVGTLPWIEQTGGKMRFVDKLSQLVDGLALQLSTLPASLRWRVGMGGKAARRIDLSALAVPDTAAAEAALTLCKSVSPPFMVAHCARTYWFARLLGLQWGLAFDDELLYVAGILHDIALMDDFEGRSSDQYCFTIPSAECARNLAAEAGWDDRRQDQVAEAITLNPNAFVRPAQGMEAYLLNAGVMVDTMGLRLWEIHPETLAELLEREPRMAMKQQIVALFHREANSQPGCRFHFARRYFGFHRRVLRAPFEEQPVSLDRPSELVAKLETASNKPEN